MSRLGLVDRVRSWFGTRSAGVEADGGPSSDRWSLGSVDGPTGLALATATAVAEPPGPPAAASPAAPPPSRTAPSPAPGRAREALPDMPAPFRPRLDPMDPPWIRSLESLPDRIAQSVATSATGAKAMDHVAVELEGHRQATRGILDAVRRLPDLSTDQARLTRETNKILQRQCLLLESMFDGLIDLRAAYRTVEETSRRHQVILGQLEESHRRSLLEYQGLLLKSYRRLGRLAALAALMGAAAMGGAAYVAYLVLVAP